MESVLAKLNNLRVAPKKVRQVARLLKGMGFDRAEAELRLSPQKSAPNLRKLLLSAGANAENNFNLSKQDLFVLKVLVDPGRTLKRFRARARGNAGRINKRTSHVTIFLASRSGKKVAPAKTKKEESSVKVLDRSKKAHVQDKSRLRDKNLRGVAVKQKIFSRKAI